MHDETMEDRPRRRPVLLAMLVAAALLLGLLGSGALGSGTSPTSDDGSTGLQQGAPPATQQNGAQGFMHRGRHCHHDHGGQAPQQDPTGSPPV